MVSTVLFFVVNCLIMLAIIYGFHIIGQIANQKFFGSKFNYTMPIGFGWFMITFQIFAYPFILLQTTFSLFLLVGVLFAAGWMIYILLNRKYITWRVSIRNNWFFTMVVIFVFVLLAIKSTVYSDSWLYSAMITSTIQNNLIYSNDGLIANTQLSIMHHRFESYYLWQACVAMTFLGNYLVSLITEYKLFDAFLIIMSFAELGYQFKFGKFKREIFAVVTMLMLIAAGSFLNMSPFQTSEPPVQFLQLSTGTALFHYYLIPFSIIYLCLESKFDYRQKNIYLLGMLIVFSSLTTTFYYTLPLFYITLLTIKHLIQKRHDNQVLLAFMACWLIIINAYIGVQTGSIALTLVFTLVYIILTKVVLKVYKSMSLKVINRLSFGLYAIYGLCAPLLFNPLLYGTQTFTTDKQALRLYNISLDFKQARYTEILLPVIFLGVMVWLLIYIVRSQQFKLYSQYMLIYCMLFINPFALMVYRIIGVEPVISRIIAFSFIGYVILIAAFSKTKYKFVIVMLVIWSAVAYYEDITGLVGDFGTKQFQVNMIESSIDGLAKYDFDPNSFIVFDNLNITIGDEVYYTGVNKLVTLNPSISWDPKINSCDQLEVSDEYQNRFDHCYTIYEKDKLEDYNYIYETDKYLVYKNY